MSLGKDRPRERQDPDHFPTPAGQSVGLIHNLPGASEVVLAIVDEARAVLDVLQRRVRSTSRDFLDPHD